jgi:hypothetical protein
MGREVRRRADDVSEDLALLGELLALHARGHQGLC